MESMVKVYEEVINCSDEVTSEYKIWLNEMLEDEAIPYENKVIVREEHGELPLVFDTDAVLEIYVYENDVNRVKEIIEEYYNAEIVEEHDELNVTPEDLNYTEDESDFDNFIKNMFS